MQRVLFTGFALPFGLGVTFTGSGEISISGLGGATAGLGGALGRGAATTGSAAAWMGCRGSAACRTLATAYPSPPPIAIASAGYANQVHRGHLASGVGVSLISTRPG